MGRTEGCLVPHSQMEAMVQQFCLHPSEAQICQCNPGRVVARVRLTREESVIVKLWDKPRLYQAIGRAIRYSGPWREFAALRGLHQAGLNVPQALGYCRLNRAATGYTDALFVEDLGEAPTVSAHLKSLMREGKEDLCRSVEDAMIALTHAIISAGFIDSDHSPHNMLMLASGRIARFDLGLSRRLFSHRLALHFCGPMLGQLIALYAFTLQPNVARIGDFAARLASRLRPPRHALRRARHWIEEAMNRQRNEVGIDTRVYLPW